MFTELHVRLNNLPFWRNKIGKAAHRIKPEFNTYFSLKVEICTVHFCQHKNVYTNNYNLEMQILDYML